MSSSKCGNCRQSEVDRPALATPSKGNAARSTVPNILVIEEDAPIRELLVEWLAAQGYRVQPHTPGGLQDPGSGPDLVIVGVSKPRHGGCARLRTIQAQFPQAPILAMSGQFRPGLDGSLLAASALGVQRVIAKPFTRSDLLAAVHCLVHDAP